MHIWTTTAVRQASSSSSSSGWMQLAKRAWSSASGTAIAGKRSFSDTSITTLLPTWSRMPPHFAAVGVPLQQQRTCQRAGRRHPSRFITRLRSRSITTTANTASTPPSSAMHSDPVVAALLEVVPSLIAAKQPLVLCGPSGVGKSYVLSRLCNALPNQVALSVSHTSRPVHNVTPPSPPPLCHAESAACYIHCSCVYADMLTSIFFLWALQ